MKHKFTAREMALILICFVLAFGIFYYEGIYKPIQNDISSHSTEDLTDELTIAQAKAVQYNKMKQAVADGKKNNSEIGVYNNLASEVAELGTILNGNAEDIAIQWSDPVLSDSSSTTVRRQAAVSFETGSYAKAQELIRNMINCRYRNVVTDLEISSQTDESLSTSDDVSVSLTITFFETTEGAATTKGLVTSDSSSQS